MTLKSRIPELGDLLQLLKSRWTAADIRKAELTILSELHFELKSLTRYDFVYIFLRLAFKPEAKDCCEDIQGCKSKLSDCEDESVFNDRVNAISQILETTSIGIDNYGLHRLFSE